MNLKIFSQAWKTCGETCGFVFSSYWSVGDSKSEWVISCLTTPLLSPEPSYITMDPPVCGELTNCTLTEKDCMDGFKLDARGCPTCQCKSREWARWGQGAVWDVWVSGLCGWSDLGARVLCGVIVGVRVLYGVTLAVRVLCGMTVGVRVLYGGDSFAPMSDVPQNSSKKLCSGGRQN